MMGIVAEVDLGIALQLEVEAALHTTEALHACMQFLVGDSCQAGHRHGGHAIVDVDTQGHTKTNILDRAFRMHEVNHYLTSTNAYILGMEVALVARIGIHTHSRLHLWLYLQSFVNDEHTVGADE